MNYIWASQSPSRRERVHIQAFKKSGEELRSPRGGFVAMCEIDLHFDRSINAPFTLGRKVCKNCIKACH